MSRKKKAVSKNGIKNDSFFRIKNKLKGKVSNSFMKSLWLRKGSKKDYYLPYKRRHPLLVGMCGEYSSSSEIPKEWSEVFSRLLSSMDSRVVAYAKAMLDLDEDEWKTGTIGNKRFIRLCRDIGAKDKIEKPKLMAVLDYMNALYGDVVANYTTIKNIFTLQRVKKADTMNVYISCDPWDIFRMGVGKKSFGSCMNIEDGGYTQHLVQNFQDPSMAVVYAEDKNDRRKLKGMGARCIIRMLRNGDEYGIVIDRLYGENAYRTSMLKAVEKAVKNVGIKLYQFATYKHTAHSNAISKNVGKEVQASGPLAKFREIVPYLDQRDCGQFHELTKEGHNILAVPIYRVVETDEAVA